MKQGRTVSSLVGTDHWVQHNLQEIWINRRNVYLMLGTPKRSWAIDIHTNGAGYELFHDLVKWLTFVNMLMKLYFQWSSEFLDQVTGWRPWHSVIMIISLDMLLPLHKNSTIISFHFAWCFGNIYEVIPAYPAGMFFTITSSLSCIFFYK